MNNIYDIASIVSCVVVFITAIVGAIAWFYHRGKTENSLKEAVQDNTQATREVTAELKDFKNTTVEKLHELDIRVSRMEVGRQMYQTPVVIQQGSSLSERQ